MRFLFQILKTIHEISGQFRVCLCDMDISLISDIADQSREAIKNRGSTTSKKFWEGHTRFRYPRPSRFLQNIQESELSDLRQNLPLSVSYTHLRAHETVLDLVCRLLLE